MVIDIKVGRESYDKREISNISWITLKRNVVKGLRKMSTCERLRTILNTEKIDNKADQWVLRREAEMEIQSRLSTPKTEKSGPNVNSTLINSTKDIQ